MVRCHRGDSGGGKGSTYQSCDGKQQAFVMIIASGQDVAVTSLFHVRLATQLFHVWTRKPTLSPIGSFGSSVRHGRMRSCEYQNKGAHGGPAFDPF